MEHQGIVSLLAHRPRAPPQRKRTIAEAMAEHWAKLGRELGNGALKYLRGLDQGLDFEFHSTVAICTYFLPKERIDITHGNFRASRKAGESSEVTYLFFAEAMRTSDGLKVLNCSIIDEAEKNDETKYVDGCDCCESDYNCFPHVPPVVHPIEKFTYGADFLFEEDEAGAPSDPEQFETGIN